MAIVAGGIAYTYASDGDDSGDGATAVPTTSGATVLGVVVTQDALPSAAPASPATFGDPGATSTTTTSTTAPVASSTTEPPASLVPPTVIENTTTTTQAAPPSTIDLSTTTTEPTTTTENPPG